MAGARHVPGCSMLNSETKKSESRMEKRCVKKMCEESEVMSRG